MIPRYLLSDIKQNKKTKMKLIITNIATYKEKDAIVTGFNENEVVTFRVPGLFSPKNKFASLNNVLTIIEPTFSEARTSKHLLLKEAELLFSPMMGDMDFNYITAISILLEATVKFVDDAEKPSIYNDLFNALLALKNKINPYLVSLKYLISVMNMTGYELSINHCVRCQEKKNIVAFSFVEGGFICKDCLTNEDHNDLEIPEMKLFRNLYLFNGYDFSSFKFDEKVVVSILNKLNIFFKDAYGSNINAIKTL